MRRVRRASATRSSTVEVVEASEPSPESPTDNAQFALLAEALAVVAPGVPAVPYVMMAATDSRHFHRFSPAVYRFAPLEMSNAQRASIHGVDERVEIAALERGERSIARFSSGYSDRTRHPLASAPEHEGAAMTRTRTLGTLATVVGFLAFVEFTSGVLQGYYTPMLTDIARHLGIHDADVNWLEGAQLMLSALVVPAFAKLGDMVGHKRMLLISTALTAAAALVLPFTDSFAVFLVGLGADGVLRRVAAAGDRADLVALALDGRPLGRSRRGRPVSSSPRSRAARSSAPSSAARSSTSLPLTVVLLVPGRAHRRLLLRDPVRGQGVARAHRRRLRHASASC